MPQKHCLDRYFKELDKPVFLKIDEFNIKAASAISNDRARTLIELASQGDVQGIKKIINDGVDINAFRQSDNYTSLHVAAKNGHTDVVLLLLENKARILFDSQKLTALHLAASNGNLDIILGFLRHKVDSNIKGHSGRTPLHCAIHNGCVDSLEILIKYGANVNLQTKDGSTALHLAVYNKNTEIIEALLNKGADILCNKYGETPLHVAAKRGYVDVVSVLVKKGVKVDTKGHQGQTALHQAVGHQMVTTLLEHGANINAERNDGLTALYLAVFNKNIEVIEALLNNRARILCGRSQMTPLHVAAQYGYKDAGLVLINKGVYVNSKNRNGETALHHAVEYENNEMVTTLLDNGASVDVQTNDGLTPLHMAVENVDFEIIETLLNKGAGLRCIKYFETPLHMAVRRDYQDILMALLKKGVDVNIRGHRGQTALILSLYYNNEEIVKILLEHGTNVNAQTDYCLTALHNSVYNRNMKITEALLNRGAVNVCNKFKESPLHMAAKKGLKDIVLLLLKKGVDVNFRGRSGQTALHTAVRYSRNEVVKTLLEHGANVNSQTDYGLTALYLAINLDNVKTEIIETLLSHKIDVNARNNSGKTVLHRAARYGHDDVVIVLLEHGSSIDAEDGNGETALYMAVRYAAEEGNISVLNTLLDNGADVNFKNKKDNTPLHYAIINWNYNLYAVINRLIDGGAKVDIKNGDVKTSLDLAMEMECDKKVVELEGILKEIPPTVAEKRDIMILRNELAYFMTRKPTVVKNSEEIYLEAGEVPETSDNQSCNRCPYNAICMAYSKHANEDMSSKTVLSKVHSQLSSFLTSAHINYFIHWSFLLDIEMSVRKGQKDLRDIYTLSPIERKNKGKCLIDLKITDVSEDCNGTFSHSLSEVPNQATNFLLSGFTETTYVVVSVENRPAVSTGFITDITADCVTVSLDKNLNKKYRNRTFFLDAYDSTTFLTFNLSSLALILDPSERSHQLRNIIVDRQPASFQPKLPKVLADKAKPILKRLNRVQQRAVLKAIAANEYFLIKGMPGTGKTATIVALIQLQLELKKSVLITSHTHSAVDNVCLKLIQFGVKFMRLGSEAKMNADLREYSEKNLTRLCKTPEELEKVYNEAQVLAVTCLGSGHPVLSKRILDICIVDESTQVLQCSVFRPLHAAKTFILIGDPDQLPAVVRNRDAIDHGMNESLFQRLNSEESRITLNLNYRMNEPITGLANALTYNGELLIGADRVATATLKIPKFQELCTACKDQTWLLQAIDTSLENAVQFIDTGPVWNINKEVPWARTESFEESANENQKCVNIFEAAVICRLVQALIYKGGVDSDQIGVICTYRAQVVQLADLLQRTSVDVNTVDQFQGKDKSVIIYSCSKSKDLSKKQEQNKYDLLEDKRRLNVAITRAKHKLIIVGDFATLHNYSTFKKIQDYLEKNVIKLTECEGFNWDSVLDLSVC